jgi:hypothetical protein
VAHFKSATSWFGEHLKVHPFGFHGTFQNGSICFLEQHFKSAKEELMHQFCKCPQKYFESLFYNFNLRHSEVPPIFNIVVVNIIPAQTIIRKIEFTS